MIDIKKKSRCTGCSACYNICPYNCIEMVADREGFQYPIINKSQCRQCGLCEKVCPELHTEKEEHNNSKFYVGNSISPENVANSSSGGAFVELAKKVLHKSGIVYGAAFNDDFVLNHISIGTEEELYKLQKSKYIQSNINDTYRKIKQNLCDGKIVLFCGTPCQVSGLKKYIGNKADNLILVDFICHGVPSQEAFKKYIRCIREEINEASKIVSVDFRIKTYGWESYGIKIEFESGNVYEKKGNEDYWIKAFLQDIMLRPSCYECINKGMTRESDITIADAWGIKQYNEKLYNEKGTSLVIVHTKKGLALCNGISGDFFAEEVSEDFIKKYNMHAYYPAILDYRRKKFFKKLQESNDYKISVDESIDINTFVRIQRKIKKERMFRNGK